MRVVCLFTAVLLSTLPCFAQGPQWEDGFSEAVSSAMRLQVETGQITGAVTVTADSNGIVLVTTDGSADVEGRNPIRRDAIFRIASMTKLVTATSLLQLSAEGLISLDDAVSKFIPAFAEPRLDDGTPCREITVRDLLTHTAGLPRSSGRIGLSTLQEEVEAIGRKPLRFHPGDRWEYSSGITVAGRLIEVISGVSLQDYFRQHIFEPLGMQDTAFVLTEAQASRLVTTCRPGAEPGELQAVEIPDPTQPRMPNPSGGLYSTADDMAKFGQAILRIVRGEQSSLMTKSAVTEMLTPQTGALTTGFTPGNQWGLGWCLLQHPQGVTRHLFPGTFGHGGAWGTQLWIDPARGLVLLLMIQRTGFGNSDGSDVRDAFTEAVLTSYRGRLTDTSRFQPWHGYTNAIELSRGETRVVLCPEAGGRVLEYSLNGFNSMYVDPRERAWRSGDPPLSSAGRFDFGPELVVPSHPIIWSGAWSSEITGPASARMVSQEDPQSGLQVIRDFHLEGAGSSDQAASLSCRQTLVNVSDRTVEYCHWGRSFSPGGGICLIPRGETPSRFPAGYVMYEESAILNANNEDPLIRQRGRFVEILAPPRRPKLGFDSFAGWLGYVMPGDHLFIKRFRANPDRVYNEVAGLTVSVWYPQQREMIELEPIGPRERLAPGEAASFTEHWSLVQFPFPAGDEAVDLEKVTAVFEQLPELKDSDDP